MSRIEQIRSNIRNHLEQQKKNTEESIKRRNNKWNKYYQSNDWKQLRKWKIINNPICEVCARSGLVIPATEIHHKRPFSTGETEEEKWRLLLDPSNVISVCSECHDEFHKQLQKYHTTCIDMIESPRAKLLNS